MEIKLTVSEREMLMKRRHNLNRLGIKMPKSNDKKFHMTVEFEYGLVLRIRKVKGMSDLYHYKLKKGDDVIVTRYYTAYWIHEEVKGLMLLLGKDADPTILDLEGMRLTPLRLKLMKLFRGA